MIFYFGRHYASTSIGGRIREVICDKCKCQYFYELTLMGAGSADAPYAIGSDAADKRATEQAERDLEKRLADEAELVPCPKCHWINDNLIQGYRRGRYRGWTRFVLGLLLVGICITLIGAWFLSIGPQADRSGVPSLLIGGPVISITLAGSIVLLRNFHRNRIQPNRDYPLAPKVPRGSPVPLILNPSTGELELALATVEPDGGDGVWMDFQIGRSVFPSVCCGCLADVAPGSGHSRPVYPGVALMIPLCKTCASRWKRRGWLGALLALLLVLAVVLPVLYILKLDEIIFWLAVGCVVLIIPMIGATIAGNLDAPFRVKSIDSSRGVVKLWFRNASFPKPTASETIGI
jgi:hypothetical protein